MNTNQKSKILLVDDDPFLQCLYRKTLEREGFSLLTADDGLAAIEKLSELSADLVVLDLMLPKMDGLQVLESIRADRRHHDLPVLILSNAYLPQMAQKAMKAGATLGMLKSECSPKQLVKVIREILEATQAKDGQAPAGKGSWIPGLPGRKTEPTEPANSPDGRPVEADNTEAAAATEAQRDLQKSWRTEIAMLRGICLKYAKAAGSQEAEDHLKEIYRRLRLLSARSTMAGWSQISELSSALEAMLFERGFNSSKRLSQSAVQTMFQAVDGLEYLLNAGPTSRMASTHKTRILLVDDDPVCNCANELALKRVNFETVCTGDGVAALALLESSTFDLILMDINMPVLSGLEACEKLRDLPGCKEIPVIFVTMQDDFKSRAQSVLCGGNGLIAKPISPLELIVKTLIFLLHPQDAKAPKPAQELPAAGSAMVSRNPAEPQKLPATPATPPKVENCDDESPAPPAQTTEERAADCARLMGGLEAALAAAQKEKGKLAREMAVVSQAGRAEVETALLKNEEKQTALIKQIEETWLQFEAQQRTQAATEPPVPATPELPADRPEVTEKVRDLTEALTAQTRRCESAEEQAAGLRQQHSAIEAALMASDQAQAQLRTQVTELQSSLDAQVSKLAGQTKEFEARHSTLSARVQELTEKGKASAKVIQDLQNRTAHSENEVETSRRELAGLRYAILNAARLSAKLHREQLQQERHRLDARRQLAALLAQTPLSLAQRGLLASLQSSLDGPGGPETQIPAYPIETPDFHDSEFSLAEVLESAGGAVRSAAEANGVAARVSTSGSATGKVNGYAGHLHRLITLLAVSPLTMAPGICAIDLRVTLTPAGGKSAELNLRIALSTGENAQELVNRLARVTSAATALQSASLNEAEFGLAAGWQLALAIGGRAATALENGKDACLLLSLPMALNPDARANHQEACLPNGHGSHNGHLSRNGKDALLVAAPA
jgi:CheY-like chemotaxis protein